MYSLTFRSLNVSNRIVQKLKYYKTSKQRRFQEVGFKTENIINANELTYIVNQKLTFKDGKCLVYRSKKGPFISFRRFLPYYTTVSTIGLLIYLNPFKAIFPAAIPILWILQLIVIKMMFKRYQWNQSIAHQIYLLQTGSTSEVYFADTTRRKLFGEPQSATYYNTIFADPVQKEKEDIMPNYNPFPENLQDFQKDSSNWAWCKYYSNGQNFLLIPTNTQFMIKDVMVNILKGKTIKNN